MPEPDDDDAPLRDLIFSVAGPGKVGASLAHWAIARGARLARVAARVPRPGAGNAAGWPESESLAGWSTAGDDLLLLCVPEAALPEVAAELARRPQARVVLHTAGSLPAAVLAPLRSAGTIGTGGGTSAIGSLHPLKAFPRPLPDPAAAEGVFFAVDGEPAAVALARRLVAAWGGVAAELPAETRLLYHFAATLAAGGVMTLLALADELANRLGLDPAVGRGYLELARGALGSALAAGAAGAAGAASGLTGPVARGDRGTFEHQVTALAALAPEKVPLVLHLARETLCQQARVAPLDEPRRSLLAEIERRLTA